MSDVESVRFRRDQVSVFNGNKCPLSAGSSVRNHRNMHEPEFQQIVRDVEAKYQASHERVRKWLKENDML